MSKMIRALLYTGVLAFTSLGTVTVSVTVTEASTEATITCSSGTFQLGSPASMTCHFHIDVRAEKQSFYVEHIPVNSVGFLDPQYAANCNIDDQGTHCLPRHVVKGSVTDQVELDLGNATTDSGGFYRCRLVNLPDESSRWCMLTVLTVLTGLPEDLYIPTLKPSQSTEPDTPHCENGKGCQTHMGTILVLVIILLVLVVTGIITVLYRRSYKLVKRNASATNQVENPQQLTCLPCLGNKNGKPVSDNKVEFEKETSALIVSSTDNTSPSVSTESERIDGRLNPHSNVSHSAPANHYKPESTEPRFEREAQQPPDTRTAAERSQWSREPRRRQPEMRSKEEEVKGEGEEEVFKDAPGTDKPLSEKEKKKLEDKRKKREEKERSRREKSRR